MASAGSSAARGLRFFARTSRGQRDTAATRPTTQVGNWPGALAVTGSQVYLSQLSWIWNFSVPFFFSFPSRTPITLMLVHLILSQKSLKLLYLGLVMMKDAG